MLLLVGICVDCGSRDVLTEGVVSIIEGRSILGSLPYSCTSGGELGLLGLIC